MELRVIYDARNFLMILIDSDLTRSDLTGQITLIALKMRLKGVVSYGFLQHGPRSSRGGGGLGVRLRSTRDRLLLLFNLILIITL